MAGNQNSGGYQPNAPQNNFGISATGGAGSADGQPNRYISGGKYGEGQALMQQQQGATMSAGSPTPQAAPMDMEHLLSPSNNPSEPVTAGVDAGPGPGSDILPANLSVDTTVRENKVIVDQYLPMLMQAADLPDAPDSYKRFVGHLMSL